MATQRCKMIHICKLYCDIVQKKNNIDFDYECDIGTTTCLSKIGGRFWILICSRICHSPIWSHSSQLFQSRLCWLAEV
jgi:hypothetical protein